MGISYRYCNHDSIITGLFITFLYHNRDKCSIEISLHISHEFLFQIECEPTNTKKLFILENIYFFHLAADKRGKIEPNFHTSSEYSFYNLVTIGNYDLR